MSATRPPRAALRRPSPPTLILLILLAVAVAWPAALLAQPDGDAPASRPCDEAATAEDREACRELAGAEPDDDDEALDHPDLDPEFDGYSNRWTGAFVGFGAFGGPAWTGNSETGSEVGWTVGVRARMNQVLSLFDVQVDYRYSSFETTFRSAPIGIDHHAVGAALGVHPLFLLNLGGNRLYYALAAFYLQFGLSFDVTGVSDTRTGQSGSDADWGINVGFGGDFPVTDPNVGNSLWIGALYRFSKNAVDVAPFDGIDLAEHIAVVSLSLRHNGLIF